MGLNIPRPRKRPKSPIYNDGIIGTLTAKEVWERYKHDTVKGIETKEISKPIETSPLNCPNCCAPIVKDYCEYCGTRFGFTVVKVDGFKKREEIERLKKATSEEKTLLFADNSIVAEFHRFGNIAHDIGDTPGTTTQYR